MSGASQERTKSALIVALTREVERLTAENARLVAQYSGINFILEFHGHDAVLVIFMGKTMISRTIWAHADLNFRVLPIEGRYRNTYCFTFLKYISRHTTAYVPLHAHRIIMQDGSVKIDVTNGNCGLLGSPDGDIHLPINVGFDIMRRFVDYYCKDGLVIPVHTT
jgi:hypothetical protein